MAGTNEMPELEKMEAKSLDVEPTGIIVMKSIDEKSFEVPKKFAYISKLVSQALENDANATEVPIPGAKGAILDLVVQYMGHHAGVEPPIIEKPLRSKLMKDVVKVFFFAQRRYTYIFDTRFFLFFFCVFRTNGTQSLLTRLATTGSNCMI